MPTSRGTRRRLLRIMLALACAGAGSGAVSAQVPDGIYRGVTTQNRTFNVTVSGGQITAWTIGFTGLCGATGTTNVTSSCSLSGNAFSCGLAFCNYVGFNSAISGVFTPPHVTVEIDIVGPCCLNLNNMPALATDESLLLGDGFETASTGAWSTTSSPGPFLELFLRNRYWTTTANDTFSVQVDGVDQFVLGEAVPGWQGTYRRVVLDFTEHAGLQHSLKLTATSSADGTRADFQVDDLLLSCPGGANALNDPGFEAAAPNPDWTQLSTTGQGLICPATGCSTAGANSGTKWVELGRRSSGTSEVGSVSQTATFPSCS